MWRRLTMSNSTVFVKRAGKVAVLVCVEEVGVLGDGRQGEWHAVLPLAEALVAQALLACHDPPTLQASGITPCQCVRSKGRQRAKLGALCCAPEELRRLQEQELLICDQVDGAVRPKFPEEQFGE